MRVILLAGLAGLCSPNYSTGFCSTQHKVRQDSTTSDTSLECVRTKGTIKVNSMVKTSRTSPSKRPIPGGVFRKFHCHVLEPTQSSLTTCSDVEGGSYHPVTPVTTIPPSISNSHTCHVRIEISPFRPSIQTTLDRSKLSMRPSFIRNIVTITTSICLAEGPVYCVGKKQRHQEQEETLHTGPQDPRQSKQGRSLSRRLQCGSSNFQVTHQ